MAVRIVGLSSYQFRESTLGGYNKTLDDLVRGNSMPLTNGHGVITIKLP